MYATCLFCHSALGRNEVLERFPVGRRLAFDSKQGRLWVICGHCRRWNLTPVEERWEAIEECERRYRATRLRVSSENIGFAPLREGLELVRIGAPLRPELAAWRYGNTFRKRRRRALAAAGVTATATAFVAPMLLPAVVPSLAGLYTGTVLTGVFAPMLIPPGMILMDVKDHLQWERVVARVRGARGNLLTVRAKHLHGSAFYTTDDSDETSLRVLHDDGAERFEGNAALATGGRLLARANWLGGASRLVDRAVRAIEDTGDASSFLLATGRRFARFHGKRLMAEYRRLGALNLAPVERLALEMAVNEQRERRAMEGELAALAQAWREAEEIAAIADDLLTPRPVRDWLRARLDNSVPRDDADQR